ncbi:hypothetical protein BRADI_1g45116v3 [Brachypodium distachyon]|uniref:Uncharacterized protein n=1 Tax=Brachypodium distachyon TaxID=15368 RepID=A0A0Q3L6M0_BRADI|nr:hypothetical protein BRADI_1g45116v3 [Brachypodium distachyon]
MPWARPPANIPKSRRQRAAAGKETLHVGLLVRLTAGETAGEICFSRDNPFKFGRAGTNKRKGNNPLPAASRKGRRQRPFFSPNIPRSNRIRRKKRNNPLPAAPRKGRRQRPFFSPKCPPFELNRRKKKSFEDLGNFLVFHVPMC